MKYFFDDVYDRRGTSCLKWDVSDLFGVESLEMPFWIADTDFSTVPEVVDAIQKRCEHPIFGYSIPGPDCIHSVQRWYARRHDWSFGAQEAFASIGVVTVLRYAIEALTSPGDEVLVFSPVYNPFFDIINNTGRRVADHRLVQRDGGYEIDYEVLEKQLAGGVRTILFCNPHNPMGKIWTRAELERLGELCEKYDVFVLSDEVHGDIELRGLKYTPMAAIEKMRLRCAVFTSISKSFNLAGLGASCIIVPEEQARKKIKDELGKAWIMSPNVLANVAMEAAYNHGDLWLDELLVYLAENSDLVQQYLADYMPGIKLGKHEGTFLMWLDFSCTGLPSSEVTRKLAGEFGVGLGNGSSYGSQADGFMRFNIACRRELLLRGLESMREFYRKYCKS